MKGDKINSILEALRNQEKLMFSRKDWARLVNSVVESKESAVYLRSYMSDNGFIEYVVRLTEKGKARLKK